MNIAYSTTRRRFRKKVKVLKDWGDLFEGDILESVTQVKGQYTGLLKKGPIELKRSIPVQFAQEL